MNTSLQTDDKIKQEFDGVLHAGLILGIIGSSILIATFGVFGIYLIYAGLITASIGFAGLIGASVFIFVILIAILMIGPIITLIFTVRFLKGKSDNKTAVGVLNIFFSFFWLISGILILVGNEQKNKVYGPSSEMSQHNQEYQEFLRQKEQNKINR